MFINFIIFINNFIQDIHKYIIENKYVSTAHKVSAVMYLQSVLHIRLCSTWNMILRLH